MIKPFSCNDNQAKRVLSFDLGTKHTAWGLLQWLDGEADVAFGLTPALPLSTKDKIDSIIQHMEILRNRVNPSIVLVERQVSVNTAAMCIMYAVVTYWKVNGVETIVFDPKDKFRLTNVVYDGKKKEHKKLIETCVNKCLLYAADSTLVDIFNQHKKRDDISDALFMSLQYGYEHGWDFNLKRYIR